MPTAFISLALLPVQGAFRRERLWDVNSDGEEVALCSRCYMPIGELFGCNAPSKIRTMLGSAKLHAYQHDR